MDTQVRRAQHTPGPWSAQGDEVTSASGEYVATTAYHTNPDDSQRERDAALIAAAPDLLAALREIEIICTESAGDCRRRMGTRLGNVIVAARTAIAKAEGRAS